LKLEEHNCTYILHKQRYLYLKTLFRLALHNIILLQTRAIT